ncbi:hypothetical protein ACP4OV_010236 [Aristida adscensionis]
MIFDHANAFSNRPMPPYPPEYPVLTANILHHARLGDLAPLEREAAEALATGLADKVGGGGGVVDDVRGLHHRGVFALIVRLCFGDGLGERDVAGMLLVLQQFFDSYVAAKASERSWLARLRMLSEPGKNHNGGGGGFRSYVDTLLELRIPIGDDAGDGEHARRCPLTDKEVVYLVWEFLGAGTLSVITCLEWTLANLADKPEIQEKLHREVAGYRHDEGAAAEQHLPYLHAVVLEILRLHPPIPFMKRDVHAEAMALDISALPLQPEDLQVSIVLGAIGRDRKLWKNSNEFNPERFLEGGEGKGVRLVAGPKEIKMMPFGAGRRRCPGWFMGLTHIKCFLAELVRELEWSPPAEGCIDFTDVDGFRKLMKKPLRVRSTPRNNPK